MVSPTWRMPRRVDEAVQRDRAAAPRWRRAGWRPRSRRSRSPLAQRHQRRLRCGQAEDVGRLARSGPPRRRRCSCFSPRPSMSKARRETKCLRCSMRWNGQANSPVQRRTTVSAPEAVVSRARGVCSGQGQWVGNANGLAPVRPLVQHDADDLRNDIAGPLDDHRVADAACPCGRSRRRCAGWRSPPPRRPR